jgi:molybdopterin-guanine dinucleotide biosynthesis protein
MTAFPCLIVEGTSGVGKSTLIDALLRRHAATAELQRIRTLVHLAQSHTYGPLALGENARTLTVKNNREHLERTVGMMEWLDRSVQEHTRAWCFAILDTLHLTHCVRPGVVKWHDVKDFDHRLAALGCKLLFLHAQPETIWERGIQSRKDEQFIREYSKKFGRNLEEIHQYFVREQNILAESFEQATMPKMMLETERPGHRNPETAYRFWTEDVEQSRALRAQPPGAGQKESG